LKRIISMLLCCVLLFCGLLNVLAVEATNQSTEVCSTELVVFVGALFNRIEYDEEWFDINSDGKVNIIDLVCLKKYAAGMEVENYKPIKSITVTYKYADRTEKVKQYTSKCILPALSVGYWKNGTTYFNPQSVTYLYDDAIFNYSKNKGIETPVIPL